MPFILYSTIVALSLLAARGGWAGDPLLANIREMARESGAESVSVALFDLQTGRTRFMNPHTRYHPASTMKVAVMAEVFRHAREGRISLDEPVSVINAFKSIGDGREFSVGRDDDADSALHDRIGGTATIRELVRRMIVRSSNLATNTLIELVGADSVSALMRRIGAADILVLRGVEDNAAYEKGRNNSATARGLMVLMRSIAEGKAGAPRDCDEMARILAAQEFNEGIPAGVPRGIRVAHKTGWITGIYHDAAIVYPRERRPYVLVVMTRGISEVERAHRLVSDISKVCFQWILASDTNDRRID